MSYILNKGLEKGGNSQPFLDNWSIGKLWSHTIYSGNQLYGDPLPLSTIAQLLFCIVFDASG